MLFSWMIFQGILGFIHPTTSQTLIVLLSNLKC